MSVEPSLIFLLSPANCGGERAALLMRERARSETARQLRSAAGAPLRDVFTFLSSLYFRGKAAYAVTFARPPAGLPGALAITPGAGLLTLDYAVNVETLAKFASVEVKANNAGFSEPLRRDARALCESVDADCRFVLLGSIATGKYVGPLLDTLGERLLFPAEFVGRGDMSRGALLLRCAREGHELEYVPVTSSRRTGRRARRVADVKR